MTGRMRVWCVGLVGVLAACAPGPLTVTSVPPAPASIAPTPTVMLEPIVVPSGVRVQAKISPTCPGPVRPDQVCEAPYQGDFVVTDAAGSLVAAFATDANGQALIDLPPGEYVIAPKLDPQAALPQGGPVGVSVPIGGYVDVTLELDSGMR